MKNLLFVLTIFSTYLHAMDPKVMPGPWCVAFNNFKPKVVRHANFHARWPGYGCDKSSSHKLNLLALDNDYAIPIFSSTMEEKEFSSIDKVLVAAENQQQYEADNYQIVVLKAPDARKWRRATKYPYPPELHQDDPDPSQTPIVHSTVWEKAYIQDDNHSSNEPHTKTEWVASADWVKWVEVNEPYAIHNELTRWDKPAFERLAILKRATAQAALFCYINQKLHRDDPAYLNSRYQNEIRYLEGLGRLWIQYHPNDFPARQAAEIGAAGAIVGGALAGPPGVVVGGALGAVNGYFSITKSVGDEDEDRFERCASILNI